MQPALLGLKLARPPQRQLLDEDAGAADYSRRQRRLQHRLHAPVPSHLARLAADSPPAKPAPRQQPRRLDRRQRFLRLYRQQQARLAAQRAARRSLAQTPLPDQPPCNPADAATEAAAVQDAAAQHLSTIASDLPSVSPARPGGALTAQECACRQRLAALGNDWGAWLRFIQREGASLSAVSLEDSFVRLRIAAAGSVRDRRSDGAAGARETAVARQRAASAPAIQAAVSGAQCQPCSQRQQAPDSVALDALSLSAVWQQLSGLAQAAGPELQPQQWGNVAYAAAKLGRATTALLAAVEMHTLPGLPAMRGAALANTAWAFAMCSAAPSAAWLAAWCAGVDAQLPYLNPHQVATCLWVLGRLRYRAPGAFVQRLLTWYAAGMGALAPTELSNAAWALSQLRFKPSRRWLLRWAWFSARAIKADAAPPALLAGMLASMAVLRHAPSPQWRYEWRRSLGRQLDDASGRHLCLALCAAAKLRWPLSAHWVHVYGHALQRVVHTCTPSDLAAAVWALPRVAYPYPGRAGVVLQPVLAQVATQLEPQLQFCTPAQLVQLAVGFASLGFDPGVHWMKLHENACSACVGAINADNRERLRRAYLRIWGVK